MNTTERTTHMRLGGIDLTPSIDPRNPHAGINQYAEVKWVSEDDALRWLEASERAGFNRRISQSLVNIWADRFNEGRFQLTHQGIAFDEEGVLLDGQHRLYGLIESDVAGVWMQVAYNVDRAGFTVMDTGMARGAGQFLPGPNANVKAAVARLLMDFPNIVMRTGRIDNAPVFDTYTALPRIEDAVEGALVAYRGAKINATIHGAVLTVALTETGLDDKVAEWIEGVSTGAGLHAGDPRLTLRNRWALEWKHLNHSGSAYRHDAAFLIVRAWNAFLAGEELTRLQLPKGGTGTEVPVVRRHR